MFSLHNIVFSSDIVLLNVPNSDADVHSEGLTAEVWRRVLTEDKLGDEQTIAEIQSRVYHGGIDHSIRWIIDIARILFFYTVILCFQERGMALFTRSCSFWTIYY